MERIPGEQLPTIAIDDEPISRERVEELIEEFEGNRPRASLAVLAACSPA